MRWLPLLAVTLLATGVRFFHLDSQSLWYDEGISAFQLTRSFPDIVRAAALDTHPPLYYWTLKAWAELFGASESGLRSLSATWGVAGVAITWLLGRRLFGVLAATTAATLLAVAPLAVYYAQEVRMYSQVTALALLATYAYSRRIHWLYVLSGVATLYSQYLGIAVLAALNLHALIWWRTRTRREWLIWLAANGAIAVAFLPWLPTFLDQQGRALNTSPRSPLGLLLNTLSAYGGGIAAGDVLVASGGVLVVLALFGLALSQQRCAASLAALVWLLPLGLVLGLGLRSGLFEVRYLVLGLPGLMLLSGLGITRVARYPVLAVALTALLVVPAGLALTQQYFDPRLARDDYRALVQAIQDEARASDAVVLSAPNQVEIFSYYYRGPLATFALPAQRPIDADDTRHRLDALRGQYERIWLVQWAMSEADPKGVIHAWLAENGFPATHHWYGSVQLALIGFAPPSAPTESLDLELDNGIVLEGFRLPKRTVRAGETVPLTLMWRATQITTTHWKVFTHLLNGVPRVVAQRDAEPGDNLRPTPSWQVGEHVPDNYGIPVPGDLPPGDYALEVGMYDGERRATFANRGDHIVLGTISVVP